MRQLLCLCAILLVSVADLGRVCAANETVRTESPQPRRQRVLLIVRNDCPKCEVELQRLRSPGGTFEAMQAKGWIIATTPDAHIQIVNRTEVPEFAQSLQESNYPAVVGIDGPEVLRYFNSGCTTPLDPWTFGWVMTGKNERPTEPILESARVATTGNYRLRGNHWSIEGEFNPTTEKLVAHLQGPNHAASAAAYGSLETWSLEELRSLHDDLHEREGGLSSGVGRSSRSPASSSRPVYLIPKSQR